MSIRFNDVGKKFNKLTILRTYRRGNSTFSLCQCDCGNKKVMRTCAVRTGKSKSCGCNRALYVDAKRIDLSGQRFGNWTVIQRDTSRSHKNFYSDFLCRCDCGTQRLVTLEQLKKGRSQSCGCLKGQLIANKLTTHGLTNHYLYETWSNIKKRCFRSSDAAYKHYGKRGIKIFPDWIGSFESFYNYIITNLGERPTNKHTIDRIDNDGNYEPGNIRWADKLTQMQNRRNTKKITAFGITLTLLEWCQRTGWNYGALKDRIFRYKLSPEEALTRPSKSRSKCKPDLSWLKQSTST